MQPEDFTRIANNFYNSKGMDSKAERINVDADFVNYFHTHQETLKKKYKVAFVFICLNPLYWEYAPEMVATAKQFFLPGHDTDFLFWTDIPEKDADVNQRITEEFKKFFIQMGGDINNKNLFYQDVIINGRQMNIQNIIQKVTDLRKTKGVTIFPTESVEWPYPTLLRYNLFLQQEEKLKDYDYIFYCDTDMRFVDVVGDEILGNGLTAAPHPGYYIPKELYPPYEPNELSASYIKRPGRIVQENNKPRFRPEYYAGGFQGGKTKLFIEAMKACKALIDTDLKMKYIPIWNDETAWNKYLSENPPDIMLTPSYIYPDSMIDEYYVPKVWWRTFQPKLVTLTKWFSISKEGGEAVAKMIQK